MSTLCSDENKKQLKELYCLFESLFFLFKQAAPHTGKDFEGWSHKVHNSSFVSVEKLPNKQQPLFLRSHHGN